MSTSESRPAETWLGRGPRQVEESVLGEVLRRLAEARADPSLLAKPLRVVVPSRSLREHLAARLVERAGTGLAGLTIQTLYGLALEAVERAGFPVSLAASAMPVLVRRAARDEPVLHRRLEPLVEGYGVVRGAVDDLFDAGFEPLHAEAVIERLQAEANAGAEVDVACAVVRVASRVAGELAEHGLVHRATVLRRAQEILAADPETVPARGIIVHGFADATGCAPELLATLLYRPGGLAVVDRPPEPGATGEVEAFVSRLRERLVGHGLDEKRLDPGDVPARVVAVEAPGVSAEVREVGRRIQALLLSGARPESIGLVARDLGPYALAVREHFRALAIPFSGLGQVLPLGPTAVAGAALVDLLRQGAGGFADRWLDARALCAGEELAPLRLALRSQGAVRLSDVARLPARESELRLPVPLGFESVGEGSEAGRVRRATLEASALDEIRAAADRCVEALERWPHRQDAVAHRDCLLRLAEEGLGWDRGDTPAGILVERLVEATAGLPPGIPIDREDVIELVERAAKAHAGIPIGGSGGGVQVLGVMEARARTFDHLFLVGLNRDVFPRPVPEDSILGDSIRRVLAELLPDMPLKARGHDEERHLFAQLLASAPEVTLSWQNVGDDGRSRAASTFVDRLRWGDGDFAPEVAEAPIVSAAQRRREGPGLRPLSECALEASLLPGWNSLAAVLPAALQERARDLVAVVDGAECDADADAKARLAVASELDRAFGGGDLGPYFGFLGGVSREDDPRRLRLSITAMERLAYCPWQSFLGSVLGVEPVKDRSVHLPEIGAAVLGTLVHGVLEAIYREASVPVYARLDALDEGDGISVPWPEAAEIDRLLRREARKALLVDGLGFSGLEAVAAERARPRVDRARELCWPGPGEALAAEARGEVRIWLDDGESESISFRADRVDRVDGVDGVDGKDGHWVFSDYKTGALISDAKTEKTRDKNWIEEMQTGRHLQAVAYTRARETADDVGRYLFLDPETSLEQLEFAVARGADRFQQAFDEVARHLLELRRNGHYVPRLVSPGGGSEGRRCLHCEVAEACIRGESNMRGRLGRWLEEVDAAGNDRSLRGRLQALWDPKERGNWTGDGRAKKGEDRR